MRISRFTIIASHRPDSSNLNEELQWLGGSLGLFSLRDKDKSCFRIFIVLLKEPRKGLSSDEIAEETGLTRGTVVHHLNKLMNARLVSHKEKHYLLMVRNLEALIENIQHDLDQTMDELKEVARKIDRQLK